MVEVREIHMPGPEDLRPVEAAPRTPVRLRNIDPKTDDARLEQIRQEPHVVQFLGDKSSPAILHAITEFNLGYTFGVVAERPQLEQVTDIQGSTPLPAELTPSAAQTDQLDGWVYFIPDNSKTPRAFISGNTRIYDITYAKAADAPPGIMADAIKQACLRVANRLEIEKEKAAARFTKSYDNKASTAQKTLDRIASEKTDVVAYVDPDNVRSIHALEKAGFIAHGMVKHTDEDVQEKDVLLFQADWNKIRGE